MRISILATALLAAASAATAGNNNSIPLQDGAADNVLSQTYTCGDAEAFASAICEFRRKRAGHPADGPGGRPIFVNVVSASGAKYVSGRMSGGPRAIPRRGKTRWRQAAVRPAHARRRAVRIDRRKPVGYDENRPALVKAGRSRPAWGLEKVER